MGLSIEVRDEGGWRIIDAKGEIDLETSPRLREAVLEGVKEKDHVGVDLSGAEYMDSSGVATLVEGLKSASESGQTFVLVRPSERVMKVLELARLDSLFDIRDSVDCT